MAMPCWSFEETARCGLARAGRLVLPHGTVETPVFMPVGTYGSVRGLTPGELRGVGAQMVLANTYHLWNRPGHGLVEQLGGLHRFMRWDAPILTDSGGYQVFSLKKHLKVSEEGVMFRLPENGDLRSLTPELAVEIQEALGVDIAMAFDECIEWPAERNRVAASTERTTRWLKRCMNAREKPEQTGLFGIVQGGLYEDLRIAHAQEITTLGVQGLAIGGLSVGEDRDDMLAATSWVVPHLGSNRARYLMGVGHPHDILDAVLLGVDMFDCVLPTRLGRHGMAYTWQGRRNMKNARYATDPRPLDESDPESPAADYSRAYLKHLVKSGEMLGRRLLSAHNLHFYQSLMRRARALIVAGDAEGLQELSKAAARASAPADD
ncbi:MAG: tRNA guanosine(34) transglycosylase Tgt [Alphaproteobacteria bacterium]|nr:tRNA guanosine(34) transglycosylase Tgt [Alphaproteobacteria bacterium]